MNTLQQFLIGLPIVSSIMILTFFYCWKKGNLGYVDVVWSYSVGGLALFYFWLNQDSFAIRQWIALVLTLVWSFRLGTHLLLRVSSEKEDGRYQDMKTAWSHDLKRRTFIFFQFQALAASVMSIAPLLIISSVQSFGLVTHWLAIAIAVSALIGEAISDHQLSRFRAKSENKGRTCRNGLWSLSRHPNYFFEWLYWCSFPLLAYGTPYFWLSLSSPLILLFLILRVTGIPPTEKNALKSRGDDYRRYQSETNAFLPWPQKKPRVQINTKINDHTL